jgi:hypothetical protein
VSPLTHKISRSTWYILAAIYLSMFAMMIATISYTKAAIDSNAQKFCAVVVLVDNSYLEHPPSTAAGKAQAENFHKLRKDLKCKSRRAP